LGGPCGQDTILRLSCMLSGSMRRRLGRPRGGAATSGLAPLGSEADLALPQAANRRLAAGPQQGDERPPWPEKRTANVVGGGGAPQPPHLRIPSRKPGFLLTLLVRSQRDRMAGGSPLLQSQRLPADGPPSVELHASGPWHNPCRSPKDRLATCVVQHTNDRSAVSPGDALLDSTSGRTGMAYGAAPRLRLRLMVVGTATPKCLAVPRALGTGPGPHRSRRRSRGHPRRPRRASGTSRHHGCFVCQ
jgi:hypothetical protein